MKIKQVTSQNSDPEADQDGDSKKENDVLRRRKKMSSITARRNWRRALDDIKKARASGIYAHVSDTNEELDARERVKSILMSATDTMSNSTKIRPKSAGDAVSFIINITLGHYPFVYNLIIN